MTSATKIKIVTAAAAFLDSILVYGDKVADVPGLPPWLAHCWPIILTLTVAFDRVAHIVIGDAPPAVVPAPEQIPTNKPFSTSGNALPETLLTINGLIAGALIALWLTGCGTTAGINAANFLESPLNAQIISTGVSAGINSLMISAGGKIPASAQQPLTAAASTVATGVATSAVDYIAELLRTKQSTGAAAKTGALTATLSSAVPASTASAVATAVSALAAQGVSPDKANEAVAATLNAVSAARSNTP